jgi:hypothetical protein
MTKRKARRDKNDQRGQSDDDQERGTGREERIEPLRGQGAREEWVGEWVID